MTPPKPTERIIRREVEIAAPVEAVWKALTEATELTRWFPLSAHVVPGAGGSIFLSWGPNCEGTAPIDAWEPGKCLRTQEAAPQAPPGTASSGEPPPTRIAVEWTLESRGGNTILRLVHSGIAVADWADEYHDSVAYGWGFMLANLRFYLEQHRGTPRLAAWPRRKVQLPRPDAWKRLLAAPMFAGIAGLEGRKPGESCRIELAGDPFEGALEFILPPKGFCIQAAQHNGCLLWLSLEGGTKQTEVGFWLSAYGIPRQQVADFEKRWIAALEQAFPEGASVTLS